MFASGMPMRGLRTAVIRLSLCGLRQMQEWNESPQVEFKVCVVSIRWSDESIRAILGFD